MVAVGAHAGSVGRLGRSVATARPVVVRQGTRVGFVDACRGLAVVGMLLANLVNVFLRSIPPVLAHNQGDTLRLFDFPAPLFQFMVGVSLTLFLAERVRRGRTPFEARLDALRRFGLLIALGMLLDAVGGLTLTPHWGVLQTLGLGGVAATLLAGASDGVCAGVALVLLGVFSGPANGVVHASPTAALAFVPLTLAGALVGRTLDFGSPALLPARARRVAAAAMALAVGFFAAGVPFNKVLGTSSFVALATAVSAATLAATASIEAAGWRFPSWLLLIGRHALTAWVMLHVVVYYPAWLVFPTWERLGALPGAAAVLGTTAALSASTIGLGKRGFRIPL